MPSLFPRTDELVKQVLHKIEIRAFDNAVADLDRLIKRRSGKKFFLLLRGICNYLKADFLNAKSDLELAWQSSHIKNFDTAVSFLSVLAVIHSAEYRFRLILCLLF